MTGLQARIAQKDCKTLQGDFNPGPELRQSNPFDEEHLEEQANTPAVYFE